jgi:hypothetical protein
MAWDERAELWFERLYPYGLGAAVFVAATVWHEAGRAYVRSMGLGSAELVSANFDVMITLTAFLFSVFVLAIAPGGGFIERIFRTSVFKEFKRYVVEALLLGSLSAALSLPYMATKNGGIWRLQAIDALWLALAITALLAFFRVVKIFIQWMGYDAKHREKRKTR